LCVLNTGVGFWFIDKYANPTEEKDWFSDFINPKSYYPEHVEYKEAAFYLKGITEENETILTNSYPFVWYYSKRSWSDDFTAPGKFEHAYITTVNKPIPESLKNWKIVYDKRFVKVLEN
jgi:hypothetical protein